MMEDLKVYLHILQTHRSTLRIAVIVFVMVAAVLFFSMNGNEKENSENFNSSELEFSSETTDEKESAADEKVELFVDIGGEVRNPGVYTVAEGTRLFEIIEKAGGLTGKAFVEQINQAESVTDGQKIWIPSKDEAVQTASGTGGDAKDAGIASAGEKININTADRSALQEIPGVGPATAEKIIAYRTEQGRFATIDDIKNVSGIGEKTFAKMKDKITV